MKGLRISFIVFAAAVITFGLSGMAFAFHSGGVAECMGCHNIHDGQSASYLLKGSDASSTCASASCHGNATAGSYHILTPQSSLSPGVPPLNMTPGGDFGWLLKTYTYSPRSGTTETDPGQGHGHNIVGIDLTGYVAADNTTAPGGGPTLSAFSCTDCHDQHGKLRRLYSGAYATTGAPIISSGSYNNSPDPANDNQAVGTYRLLRGPGSGVPIGSTAPAFTAVFNAVSPPTYNRAETGAGGPTKVAYGTGVSAWCSTCHPDMHTGGTKLTHPSDQSLGTVVANYNNYLGSGRTGPSGFDTLVPFTMAANSTIADFKAFSIDNATATQAATSNRVMCLSCHRAHASGWESMGRWNNAGEFIAVDGMWPGTNATGTIANQPKYAQGRTTAETIAAYNGKTMSYSSYQRSLCNKCHAKD